ncbi:MULTISPECIES: hypothetical protein [Micromonospora]|nr:MULTISPECIES: hypothetical protein [Micromonospora]
MTDRTCSGGYGRSRANRTHNDGLPFATGIRTPRPSTVKVP